MSQRIAYLEAVVGADISNYRRQMAEVRKETGILSEAMEGVGKVAQRMSFAVSLPIAAMGSAMVQTGIQFDTAMRNINSIAGMTSDQFSELSERVLEFGKNTRSGAIGSAEALYEVFSAGVVDVEQAMTVMELSVQTAEAGLADLSETTKAVTSSFLSFQGAGVSVEHVTNALTRMVQVGVGTMGQFARAVSYVNATAAGMNITIDETYASMALLTQLGVPASRAATAINAALNSLSKPTAGMTKMFKSLAVDGFDELLKREGTLIDALAALRSEMEKTGTDVSKVFTTSNAKRAFEFLTNNIEFTREQFAIFYDGLDTARISAYEEQSKSLAAQFDLLGSAVQYASIQISQELEPILVPIIEALTQAALSVGELDTGFLQLGITFASLLMVAPPLVWLLTSMLNPLGLLVAAVGTLAVVVAQNFEEIKTSVISAVKSILGEDGFAALESAIMSISNVINNAFNPAGAEDSVETVEGFVKKFDTLHDQITVEKGDTLWGIWQEKYREDYADFNSFLEANQLDPTKILNIGETLDIQTGGVGSLIDDKALNDINSRTIKNAQKGAPAETTFFSRLIEGLTAEIPNIISALSTVANAVGTWLVDEGVPLFSYHAGRFSGMIAQRLLVSFSEAFQAVVDFFSGSAPSEAVNGASKVGETIATEFSQGFAETFTGLETGEFPAMDGLADLVMQLDGLAGVGESFRGFGDAVSAAIQKISEADFGNAINYLKNLVTVGLVFGATILSGVMDAASLVVTKIGDAIFHITNAIAGFGKGDIVEAANNIALVLFDIAHAIIGVPVSILQTIVDLLGKLFSFEVPDIGAELDKLFYHASGQAYRDLQDQLNNQPAIYLSPAIEIDEFTVEDKQVEDKIRLKMLSIASQLGVVTDLGFADDISVFNPTGVYKETFEFVPYFELNPNLAGENMKKVLDDLNSITISTSTNDPKFAFAKQLVKSLVDQAVISNQMTDEIRAIAEKYEVDLSSSTITVNELPVMEMPDDVGQSLMDGLVGSGDPVESLKKALIENPLTPEEVSESIKSSLGEPLAQAIMETTGGALTPEPIVDGFLNVISTEWLKVFGEDGTVTTAWTGFRDIMTSGMDTITARMALMAVQVPALLMGMATMSLFPIELLKNALIDLAIMLSVITNGLIMMGAAAYRGLDQSSYGIPLPNGAGGGGGATIITNNFNGSTTSGFVTQVTEEQRTQGTGNMVQAGSLRD